MNWYKLIKVASEYWIADGQIMMADGDEGMYNHESYVIEVVRHNIVDNSDFPEFAQGEWVDWEGWKERAIQEKIAETQQEGNPNNFDLEDDSVIYDLILSEEGVTPEEKEIAEGNGDGRGYAIKKWGWKRVLQNNIETQTLTPVDMRYIANGMYEIFQDHVHTMTFNIYVFANSKWYNQVPFAVIEDEKPLAMRQYTYSHMR